MPVSPIPCARLIRQGDLDVVLALYRASEVSDAAPDPMPVWLEICNHPGLDVFVSENAEGIVATASLISAPNLLRSGRGHGFLENVMTHPDHRGRGHGAAVVQAALRLAWDKGLYHVMLQSGRADPGVHAFYRKMGFEADVRTAYVTRPPIAEQ